MRPLSETAVLNQGRRYGVAEWFFIILPFVIFTGYIFFYRGFELGLFSFWFLYPFLLAYLLIVLGLRNLHVHLFNGFSPTVGNIAPILWLLAVIFLVQLLRKPDEVTVLIRFWFEIMANIGTLLVGYWVARKYGLDTFCSAVVFSSTVLIIIFFSLISELDTIRRIGAQDSSSGLPAAVNHIGHALAITVVCGFHQVLKYAKQKRYAYSFILALITGSLLIMTFLTGSRAALLGLFLAALVGLCLLILNFRFEGISILIFALLLSFIIVTIGYLYQEKIVSLLNRFEWETIWQAVLLRLETYGKAINSAGEWAVLFGEPWRYEELQSVDAIPYPHNWFLSITLHFGLMMTFIFLGYLLFIIKRIVQAPKTILTNLDKGTLIGSILVVMVYISTSGRLTRVITIFLLLGICWGVAEFRSANFWLPGLKQKLKRGPNPDKIFNKSVP